MSSSTFIRLAGPLQSWAKPAVTGYWVKTANRPTLTALQGLLAGALGARRGEIPDWVGQTQFTVRVDRPATIAEDFQSITTHPDEENFRRRIGILQGLSISSTALRSFKPGDHDTALSQRTYLAGAEFIVRITNERYIGQIDQALATPAFSTYLGKKAFAPVFPFYLGSGNSELISHIPVVRAEGDHEKPGQVSIYDLSPGAGSVGFSQWVPAVANRAEWLEAVSRLSLARRSIALA